MAKTLVLGANGFIGSHLVDSLVSDGHTVKAFDKFGHGEQKFNYNENIEVIAGDYLNLNDLSEALNDTDYVFHFISTTTPASAENDPVMDIDTNIRTSVELFKLCVNKHIKKVIFASTGGAIYGDRDNLESLKETDALHPISPYAIGKLAIENYLSYFRVKHGLGSLVLRISNPYGERQPFHRKQGVIPIFLENICRDNPITVLGDGTMERDYIYVKDLTDGISSMFEKDTLEDVYNMGSGTATDINELASIAKEISQKEITIEHQDAPATFLKRSVLDTSRYSNEFGSLSKTPLEDGMRMTYDYIKHEISESEVEK